MKAALIALAVMVGLILAAQPGHAQLEACSLSAVAVSNDASSQLAHAKTTFELSCSGTVPNLGQVTKLVYRIPLADITSFEASDGFGSLKVLEGPEYATAKTVGKESVIGVIFRKGLLITDDNTSYKVNVDFDSASLVGAGANNTFSIKPGSLVASTKVTIVSTGVTETTYTIPKVNYELLLPDGSSVQTLPQGCSISNGKVSCAGLSQQAFSELEIKWIKASGMEEITGVLDKIRNLFSKTTEKGPGILKRITNKITSLVR